MYKLVFYVPKKSAEKVKTNIFLTGAGQVGNYSDCSWETEGTGQFKPLKGSKPTIGSIDNLERVSELRIEILCLESNINAAVVALKQAHPYEEAAYEVISIQNHLLS
jgi:hypothetical protein